MDAVGTLGPRWSSEGVIILRTSVHVIEGLCIVDRDFVELGDGEIGLVLPIGAVIEGFVHTSVAACQEVACIGGIDPERMVVDVLVAFSDIAEALAAVGGHIDPEIHVEHLVFITRVSEDFLVIVAGGTVVATLLPACATVGGAKHTSFTVGGFHDAIEHIGVDWGNGHTDPAHIGIR